LRGCHLREAAVGDAHPRSCSLAWGTAIRDASVPLVLGLENRINAIREPLDQRSSRVGRDLDGTSVVLLAADRRPIYAVALRSLEGLDCRDQVLGGRSGEQLIKE
jgi:hypothetical protein